MAHAAPPPPLLCLQLQAGQHAWEYLPRAARITVTEGSIVVHQRLVLGDLELAPLRDLAMQMVERTLAVPN